MKQVERKMCTLLFLVLALTFSRHILAMATPLPVVSVDRLSRLETLTSSLSRQLMLQQLYVEEKTRTEGDSGIKQVRLNRDGSKPYYTPTHTAGSVAAMHDHSDLIRTCGMGEFAAVLNGIDFRTRHNDYQLVMAVTNSTRYHATEDISFPEVPPDVLQHLELNDQISEMRNWFKAWRDGNHAVHDYRRYFKPVLCYLEGAWTVDQNLDEPFDSERHHLDASSWFDLQEKIRFMSYTGDKSNSENLAFLPRTIINVTQDGVPVFAQWNYRILCHPVSGNIKLSDLKPVDDLGSRLANKYTFEKYEKTRLARFTLNRSSEDKSFRHSLLDEIMSQIPGKDNYGAMIKDDLFGIPKVNMLNDKPLNVAYYHRWYKLKETGAMGEADSHRGFADRNLFVAETTQERVAPMSIQSCRKDKKGNVCSIVTKRYSYAIPLELIFLTPLQSWNPFGLEYKGSARSGLGMTVTAGGRSGMRTQERAFNGTNSHKYYLTPVQFFTGKEVGADPADTIKGAMGVLDPAGRVQMVLASGVRILLPEIKDLGILRTRFPIMPLHVEGSPIWKELEALRDVVMDMKKYETYLTATAQKTAVKRVTNSLGQASVATVLRQLSSQGPVDRLANATIVSPSQRNSLGDVNRSGSSAQQ